MIIRQIGSALRGKASPLQLMLASILGSMIAFVPGFWNGPGLTIALVLLLAILNANLAVALLVGLVAKLVSLPLLPVSFAIGRGLLDGPAQPLFRKIVNAPVLALFGFEHYATTGGQIVGALIGVIAGLGVIRLVRAFRRKMAQVETNSERYQRYAQRWYVKAGAWLLIGGGHGKKSYAELAERRTRNPFRPIGVVFAFLAVGLILLVGQFASGPIVTMALQRGLERANGATVDVDDAELDLGGGRLTVRGLAMADPNALSEDLLRAETLEADITTSDLLRKRIKLDRVIISEAESGVARRHPGRLVGPRPKPAPTDDIPPKPGEKSIDDYIQQAKEWKERLAQVREWIDRVAGPPSGDPDDETLRERVERMIRENGYASVVAQHLIEDAPTVHIALLEARGVKTAQFEDEVLDIVAENLSTQPYLVDGAPHITVNSRPAERGRIHAELLLASAARGQGTSRISFNLRNLEVDKVAAGLTVDGERPLRGGTMDLALDGSWSDRGVGFIDMPLQVSLYQTTIAVPGAGESSVDQLLLPLGLRGPIDSPWIYLDRDMLGKALVDAGAGELAKRVRAEAEEEIDKATEDIRRKVGDEIGERIGSGLGDLLPGKKKSDQPK